MKNIVENGARRQNPAVAVAAGLLASLAAGFVVLLLLFPYSGLDIDPPVCFSVFDYVVPCGKGLSITAACVTAVLVGLVQLGVGRRWEHNVQ